MAVQYTVHVSVGVLLLAAPELELLETLLPDEEAPAEPVEPDGEGQQSAIPLAHESGSDEQTDGMLAHAVASYVEASAQIEYEQQSVKYEAHTPAQSKVLVPKVVCSKTERTSPTSQRRSVRPPTAFGETAILMLTVPLAPFIIIRPVYSHAVPYEWTYRS